MRGWTIFKLVILNQLREYMQHSVISVAATEKSTLEASADSNADVSTQKGKQRGRSISYGSSHSASLLKNLPLSSVDEGGNSPRRILPLGKSPTNSPRRLGSRENGNMVPPPSAENSANNSPGRIAIDERAQEMGAKFLEGIVRNRSTPSLSRASEDRGGTHALRTSPDQTSAKPAMRSPTLIALMKLKGENEGAEQTIVLSPRVTGELFSPRSRMDCILLEITKTEETQNHALTVLTEVYHIFKLKEDFFAFLKKKHIATERKSIDEIKIFGQEVVISFLEEAQRIKAFSDRILLLLATALKGPAPLLTIAKTFSGMSSCCAPYHKVGRVYNNYLAFQKLLTDKGKENLIVSLNRLLPDGCRDARLKFEDYASFLIQRMPRYVLFFEQLLGETSCEDQVYPLLCKAIEHFKEGTKVMTNNSVPMLNTTCHVKQFRTAEEALEFLESQKQDKSDEISSDRHSSEARDDSQPKGNLSKSVSGNQK
jgi:hypothetical protein